MNIAVLGSGGREHALCYKLTKSKKVHNIFCIPGNAGTGKIVKNLNIDISNFQILYKEILKHKINIIIVGPEKPLVDGIVDFFNRRKILIFGPDKFASQLEGSKYFTKLLCIKNNIPTAKFGMFKNIPDAENFINKNRLPIVVKADGLASGKGVYICETKTHALNAIKEILSGKFKSSSTVLIEEFLAGEEMSYFIIADKNGYKFFGSAQDHKKVGEGDTGPNTGGMGAYSPSSIINEELEKKIRKKIIEPTLNGLKKLNHSYNGFLYAGLMIVNNEPYLIEYNIRMGDPECQVIMARLETDLTSVIEATIAGKISDLEISWNSKKSMCIVLCSKGYPGAYKKNIEIEKINNLILDKESFVFHAGTYEKDKKIYSSGGRVLNFITLSDDLRDARKKGSNLIKKLNWNNGFFRKDIGWKGILKDK
jgi:phosphoribosylamine--glycine ligase